MDRASFGRDRVLFHPPLRPSEQSLRPTHFSPTPDSGGESFAQSLASPDVAAGELKSGPDLSFTRRLNYRLCSSRRLSVACIPSAVAGGGAVYPPFRSPPPSDHLRRSLSTSSLPMLARRCGSPKITHTMPDFIPPDSLCSS